LDYKLGGKGSFWLIVQWEREGSVKGKAQGGKENSLRKVRKRGRGGEKRGGKKKKGRSLEKKMSKNFRQKKREGKEGREKEAFRCE